MSSALSRQYHSITFQYTVNNTQVSINTWENCRLIPSSRPIVQPPSVNYKYVDVPGRDGSIDLSNYLIGRPTYGDRSGSFSFIVENISTTQWDPDSRWFERKLTLANIFDGQKIMNMILDDDPGYYYLGRFYMKNWQSGENATTVTIEYRVDPYKYDVTNGQAVIG